LHDDLPQNYFCLTDQNTTAFKEVVIIRHPRVGEYAFGFITSNVVLQVRDFTMIFCYINNLLLRSSIHYAQYMLHRVHFHQFYGLLFCVIQQTDKGDEELCSVYVPTNHLYIGDIFLLNTDEIIRPNLSIREGIGKLL
jgi:uncharacterized membrane protein